MTPFTENLRRLGWNLILALALGVLGATALIRSNDRLNAARQSYRKAATDLAGAREKLFRARAERQEILSAFARFQELEARGYMGHERRSEWVEKIDGIKVSRKLLDVRYELAPQQPLAGNAPDKGLDTGRDSGVEIFASNMKLQMQLLHEEDLLNFFSDLRNNVQAYIRIRSCNVERLNHPVDELGSMAQLKAECSVDLITMRETSSGRHD